MSAIFDALFAGLEKLDGDRDIRYEMRVALDALHECSHEHEDWLNRSHRVRVAANRLERAIANLSPKLHNLGVPCEQCGSTDGWTCQWCAQRKPRKRQINLIFDDWRDSENRSIYDSERGIELSLGSFHAGSTFRGYIELDDDEADGLRAALKAGFTPVFYVTGGQS